MPETAAQDPSEGARLSVRTLQFGRAGLAALAAIMITFTSDHSAPVGLSVFSGFAIATGVVLILASWLTYVGHDRRWMLGMGLATLAAGVAAGAGAASPDGGIFFVATVAAWAALTGALELAWGLIARRRERAAGAATRGPSRENIAVGVMTLLLAGGILLVRPEYEVVYTIEANGLSFVLDGIGIAVGLLGAYTAIVAVYLAIAALSPRQPEPAPHPVPTQESS